MYQTFQEEAVGSLWGVCFACGKTNVDVQNGQMGLMEASGFLLPYWYHYCPVGSSLEFRRLISTLPSKSS